MNVAELTAKILREKGVKYVFGIPGGPSIPYMEEWKAEGIEFILTSHEAAAGIMADVTSRITGITGVCHATFGPGATNLSTGVGGALLDRSPLIAFTTEVPDSMAGRTTQMGIDHQTLFKAVTKASFRLSPDGAEEVIRRAFAIARNELPGSVHIGLPSDISGVEVKGQKKSDAIAAEHAPQNNSEEIFKLLGSAKKPLIAVGLTAVRGGIGDSLQRFLEKTRIPVVLTPMAKGIIPSDHPCLAGVLFHALSDKLKKVTEGSDLVIGLGYDPVEYNYESWMPDVPLIHFGTRENDMPPGIKSISFLGEPGQWVRILEDSPLHGDFLSGRGVEMVRREIEEVFDDCAREWGPVSAMKALRDLVPANTIMTCDVGSHLHMAGQFWPTGKTGMHIMTNGWSTMGFGIPSANAVKLNMPESPVVCLTGDGGFLMTAGEMITARRYKLNIVVVIISDSELNLIKVKQGWKNLDPYATRLIDGELFGSDTFLGVKVFRADSAESMRKCIPEAFALGEPAIINAIVPGDDYKKLIVRQ